MLTSWTQSLSDLAEIKKVINEGEEYILKIDKAVKENYKGDESEPFLFCKRTIEKLGLSPFLVAPVVDKAFRSHLI